MNACRADEGKTARLVCCETSVVMQRLENTAIWPVVVDIILQRRKGQALTKTQVRVLCKLKTSVWFSNGSYCCRGYPEAGCSLKRGIEWLSSISSIQHLPCHLLGEHCFKLLNCLRTETLKRTLGLPVTRERAQSHLNNSIIRTTHLREITLSWL